MREKNKTVFMVKLRRVPLMVEVSMETVVVTVAMSVADREERGTSEWY